MQINKMKEKKIMEDLFIAIAITIGVIVLITLRHTLLTSYVEYGDNGYRTMASITYILFIGMSLVGGIFLGKFIAQFLNHSIETDQKASMKTAKKVYVEDYTYDGDENILTYTEVVKNEFNGDTSNTAMFLTKDGSVVKVKNLDKVVSTDEEKPYVTYKIYTDKSFWHDKDEHYGSATLHLPKDMHQKVKTSSDSD